MPDRISAALHAAGLPVREQHPDGAALGRFPDGAPFHIEIASVEGPEALGMVLDAAREHDLRVHRVSQGSGMMLLSDAEITEMVSLGVANDVEVSLFVGPRAGWDTGIQVSSTNGRVAAGSLRGADQLWFALQDIVRGCELGVRSILIGDLGLLAVVRDLRASGDLPADLVVKTSVMLPAANPAAARVLEDLGANTLNLPVDLSLAQIAAIRAAVDVPLDVYVEAPDDLGGTVRHYDAADLVRLAAPVHLKYSVRNAPGIYPSGGHLRGVVLETARERVRRAALSIALMRRMQDLQQSTLTASLPA
ncbi:U32 family peptidase [Geodermatophilus sp. SYSU D01186]